MIARHRDAEQHARPMEPVAGPAARRRTARAPAPDRRVLHGVRLRSVEDTLPVVRIDALPEHTEFPDTGCAVAPSCLRCPLARCIEDEEERQAARRAALDRRNREIAHIYRRYGANADLLAATYGITRRQVFRIVASTPS